MSVLGSLNAPSAKILVASKAWRLGGFATGLVWHYHHDARPNGVPTFAPTMKSWTE